MVRGREHVLCSVRQACHVYVTNDDGATYERLTAAANVNGGYDFTATLTAESKIVVRLAGDTDGDGVVGANDTALAKAIFLDAAYEADALTRAMADANGDGRITVSDITLMKRILLGYVPHW